jgi:hypothetical protein
MARQSAFESPASSSSTLTRVLCSVVVVVVEPSRVVRALFGAAAPAPMLFWVALGLVAICLTLWLIKQASAVADERRAGTG